MTEAQIKHMVDRFLSWKLPRDNFNPDCGISFNKNPINTHTLYPSQYEPTGTNLFDAQQADAMVRHLIEGLLAADTAQLALADKLQRLCCAETEGKFFDLVTDNIDDILFALRNSPSKSSTKEL